MNSENCGGECHNDCDKDQEGRSACDSNYKKDGPYPLPNRVELLWLDYINADYNRSILITENASIWKIKRSIKKSNNLKKKFWRAVRNIYPEFNKCELEYISETNTFFAIW